MSILLSTLRADHLRRYYKVCSGSDTMTTWLVVVNSEVHTLGNPPVFNGTRATHNVPSQAVEGGSDTPLWPIWRCNIQYRICPVAWRVIS